MYKLGENHEIIVKSEADEHTIVIKDDENCINVSAECWCQFAQDFVEIDKRLNRTGEAGDVIFMYYSHDSCGLWFEKANKRIVIRHWCFSDCNERDHSKAGQDDPMISLSLDEWIELGSIVQSTIEGFPALECDLYGRHIYNDGYYIQHY